MGDDASGVTQAVADNGRWLLGCLAMFGAPDTNVILMTAVPRAQLPGDDLSAFRQLSDALTDEAAENTPRCALTWRQQEAEQQEERTAYLHNRRAALRRAHPEQLARHNSPETFEMPVVLNLGRMEHVYGFCGALRWQKEAPGSCRSRGKVAPPFCPPPATELTELSYSHKTHHSITTS